MPPYGKRYGSTKKNKTASYLSQGIEVEPSAATYLRGGSQIGMTAEEKARDLMADPNLPPHLKGSTWASFDESDLKSKNDYEATGVDRGNEPSLKALEYLNAPQNKTYFGKGGDEQMLYGEDGRPTVPISDEFLENRSRKNAYKLLTGPAELFISATEEGASFARSAVEQSVKMGNKDRFTLNPAALIGDIFYDQDENAEKMDQAKADKEQELGRELAYWEADDLFDETFPTLPYWRGGVELALEMLIPATAVEQIIGKGAGALLKPVWKGGVKTYKVATHASDYFKRNKVKIYDGEFTPAHRLDYGENPVPIGGGSGDVAGTLLRAPAAEDFFGQPQMKEGLTKMERLFDFISEKFPERLTQKERFPKQVLDVKYDIELRADNLSTSMANEFDSASKRLFKIDNAGRVSGQLDEAGNVSNLGNVVTAADNLTAVPGNPTLQDIAARLPQYWQGLNPRQRDFFVNMRERFAPLERQLIDVDAKLLSDVDKRMDIIKSKKTPEMDGFYIPRGTIVQYAEKVVDKAGKPTGEIIKRKNNKAFIPGSDKAATKTSQAAGIEDQHVYGSFYGALKGYIDFQGRSYAEHWAGKQLKNATDESGKLIGSTLNQRMLTHPEFVELQKIVKQIKSESSKLRTATTRLSVNKSHSQKAQTQAGKDIEKADRKIAQIETRKEKNLATDQLEKELKAEKLLEKKAKAEKLLDEANPFTPTDMKITRKELRSSIKEGREFVAKAAKLEAKLKATNIKIRKQDKALFKEVEEYVKVMDEAEEFGKKNIIDDASLGVPGYKVKGKTVKPVGAPPFGTKTALRRYEAFMVRSEKIEAREFKLSDGLDELNDYLNRQLDELTIVDDADRLNRQNLRDLINQGTAQAKMDKVTYSIDRELKRLDREHQRLNKVKENYSAKEIKQQERMIKDAAKAGDKIDKKMAAAIEQTQRKSDDLAELKNKAKVQKATVKAIKEKETDVVGTSGTKMQTLTGWAFPDSFAKAIDEIIEKEIKTKGKDAAWLSIPKNYNNLYRQLKSTYDFSAVGVHGWTSLYDNPKEAAIAFKFGLQAWADTGDTLLGDFIADFNKVAVQTGRLTSEDWARGGLRIGGQETEYMLRENVITSKIPLIKRFNKSFGYYGDKLRLEQADDYITGYLANGRTVEQMRLNGDIERITKELNNMTGYSDKAAGGALGELLLFAPRFLNARVQTLYSGLKGVANDPIAAAAESIPIFGRSIADALPNTKLQIKGRANTDLKNRVARRSMVRLFGHATWLTFAINYGLGNETDTRLAVKRVDEDGDISYQYNTNFMKVNFMGRDYSLYGPMEFAMKMLITVGTRNLGSVTTAAQGLVGGTVQNGIAIVDALNGDGVNSYGRKIEGEYIKLDDWIPGGGDKGLALLGFLIESHAPISLGETPSIINQALPEAMGGEGEQTAALVSTFAEITGTRQAPETLSDVKKRVAEEYNKAGKESPTGGKFDYQNLSAGERKLIDQHPDVIEMKNSMDIELQGLAKASEQRNENMFSAEEPLMGILENPNDPDMDVLKGAISELKSERRIITDNYQETNKKVLEAYEEKDEPHVWDSYAIRYYDRELEEDYVSGSTDWNKFEEEGQGILEEAYKFGGQDLVNYITFPSSSTEFNFKSSRYKNPQVKKMVEEYDENQKTLKPYWKLPFSLLKNDELLLKGLPDIENLYAEHIKKSKADQAAMLAITTRDLAIQKGQLTQKTPEGIKIPSKLTTQEKANLLDSQKLSHFINIVLAAHQKKYRKNNVLADAYLYTWYGSDPETDIVKQMKADLQFEVGTATDLSQINPQ